MKQHGLFTDLNTDTTPALTIFTSCLLFFPRHETTKNKYFKNRKNTCPLAAAPSTARPRTGLRVIQFHSQACLKPPKRNLRFLLRSPTSSASHYPWSAVVAKPVRNPVELELPVVARANLQPLPLESRVRVVGYHAVFTRTSSPVVLSSPRESTLSSRLHNAPGPVLERSSRGSRRRARSSHRFSRG